MSRNVRVPLYEDGHCIGRVSYTENLDHWDGHNYTCGSTGRHLGVGKTRAGKFYLVHGTNWMGERDSARVVSEAEAREAVMQRGDDELFAELFSEAIPVLD